MRKVKVIVVNDSALPVDMLVGRTWTEEDHIAYLRMGDELRIGYRDDLPFCDIDLAQMKPSKEQLRVKETMVLPKRTVCWVTVETEQGTPLSSTTAEPETKSEPPSTARSYPVFPKLNTPSRVGEAIVFKVLELDAKYKEGKVRHNSDTASTTGLTWEKASRYLSKRACGFLPSGTRRHLSGRLRRLRPNEKENKSTPQREDLWVTTKSLKRLLSGRLRVPRPCVDSNESTPRREDLEVRTSTTRHGDKAKGKVRVERQVETTRVARLRR
ncbi:hypothetical protein HPB47_001942 [Ixodes persulcatus]|uniref:Uncharacterized protein n=1 Tax=Ixodes persulcatus TaxID=34615 RepID=A0AC60PP50_IXOPE|nr:hypothetical protein HPB47_001942 [Ixodes persulcatus]